MRTIRVGSRKSQLALVQTQLAIDMLARRNPALQFEVVQISTTGDKILDVALSKIGDKSLFTKELECALLNGTVDFVVHSLKDVPTTMPSGLVLGCVFDRCSPDDVVLMSNPYRGCRLSDLPNGAVVGTSALRRVATLTRLYPHLKFVSVRGNLNTRLRKLDGNHQHGENTTDSDRNPHSSVRYDALILAQAGVERLGWSYRIDQVLSDTFHAVGQGALTCECRKDDGFILSVLSDLHNECAALSSIAERSLMCHLEGGCSTPIGVRHSLTPSDGHPRMLELKANVLSIDGRRCASASLITELPDELPLGGKRRYSSQENGNPLQKSARLESGGSNSSPNFTTCSSWLLSEPSPDELALANDSSATFMGIHVDPICTVARLRMARAESVGRVLANKLLACGAAEILDEIRSATAPSVKNV